MHNMKNSNQSQILTCLVVAWFILSGCMSASAMNRNFTIMLYRCSYIENEYDVLPDEVGNRMPSRPIICNITESGISIPSLSPSEIQKYEVFNESKEYLASFSEQKEFVNYIYNSHGVIIIRLILEDYCLIGYLNTEE